MDSKDFIDMMDSPIVPTLGVLGAIFIFFFGLITSYTLVLVGNKRRAKGERSKITFLSGIACLIIGVGGSVFLFYLSTKFI